MTPGREALPMGQLARGKHRSVVVRTYGRGSLLGLLSLPLAFLMASRGMNGWQRSAARDMEDDAVAMARQGYRVVAAGEYGIPLLGITYYKVTYQLVDQA
jgi:predicted dienelactone hydrolase